MNIDVTEQFPHLPHAPIVEAVIEIRARAEVNWEERAVTDWLKPKLSDYPRVGSQNEFQHEVSFGPGKQPEASQQDLGWKGLRFQSENQPHVVQFNRDGFSFSRLRPYDNWEQLRTEALRLWGIYADLARPTETQRIGLRFINRLALPVSETRFEDYIEPYAQPPRNLDLPFFGFFHQDTLAESAAPGRLPRSHRLRRRMEPQRAAGRRPSPRPRLPS